MIRGRTTFILFIIVCLLAGFVLFLDEDLTPDSSNGYAKKRLLDDINIDRVSRIEIQREGMQIKLRMENGNWLIEHPVKAIADFGRIEALLAILSHLEEHDTIPPDEREARKLSLTDFQLDPPRATIIYGNDFDLSTLIIGTDVPMTHDLYVMKDKDPVIVSTSSNLLTFIPRNVFEMRDRMLFHNDLATVSRLELRRAGGGFTQLQKAGSQWHLKQPVMARASAAKVEGILEALKEVKIASFLWDPDTGDANPWQETDESVASITVAAGDNSIGQSLLVGSVLPEDERKLMAKLAHEDTVFTVPANLLKIFELSFPHLRDKRIFSIEPELLTSVIIEEDDHRLVLSKNEGAGWMISEPEQLQSDTSTIEILMAGLMQLEGTNFQNTPETNLAAFGLKTPMLSIALLSENKSADTPTPAVSTTEESDDTTHTEELLIGNRYPLTNNRYAKFANSPFLFQIDETKIKALIPGLDPNDNRAFTNPLNFRDRKVLEIDPAEIRSITVTRKGQYQKVRKNDTGTWEAVSPPYNKVNTNAVTAIIQKIKSLRATRFVNHGETPLTEYGLGDLNSESSKLTLGLSGASGIQKSLHFGNILKESGRHAAIQGQDTVFIISTNIADSLTHDILK